MQTTIYSFQDVSVVISHPNVGQYTISGEGIGDLTISMANERTAHDVSADGSVMVSKVGGRNGSLVLNVQQTSGAAAWLKKWYNYLEGASASEWADTTVTVRSSLMQELTTCTGVSPQKLPDKPYQKTGQNLSWNLMAADIQQE